MIDDLLEGIVQLDALVKPCLDYDIDVLVDRNAGDRPTVWIPWGGVVTRKVSASAKKAQSQRRL